MDSQQTTTMIATPSHRRQHKPSSSMGSLYEVLADLDETQLHYLIQEMNHTGHQNVPVSQAVSAFESQSPSESLNTIRASMLPPVQGVQRQLSKSQRGKLRLQTAFQRAPSLRQRQRQENHSAVQQAATNAVQAPIHQPVHDRVDTPEVSDCLPSQVSVVGTESQEATTTPHKQEKPVDNSTVQPQANSQRKSPAYRRIPRPDFSLPPGVTVTDLLQLLEVEFLSSSSQQSSSPSSLFPPSSPFSTYLSPSPLSLSSPSPTPSPQTPSPNGGRSLRRHFSRLDMALDAERSASGAAEIGLGMLEPRPRTQTSLGTYPAKAPVSLESFDRAFKGETTLPHASPIVLEGIFDVLENK